MPQVGCHDLSHGTVDRLCASRSARSTPSSATSTATSERSATRSRRRARPAPQLVLFPELALTGYPPEDLLLKEHFLRDARAALDRIAAATSGIVALVGFPERARRRLQRARGARRRRGAGASTARSTCRTTASSTSSATSRPAPAGALIELGGRDDRPDDLRGHLGARAARLRRGARRRDADRQRLGLALPRRQGRWSASGCSPSARATTSAPIAFCNLVGGQDELVFDGHSLVDRPRRRGDRPRAAVRARSCWSRRSTSRRARPQRLRDARQRAPAREAREAVADARAAALPAPPATPAQRATTTSAARSRRCSTPSAEVYAALVTRRCATTCDKNGFERVVLGLSGGIDSALVALHRRRRARPGARRRGRDALAATPRPRRRTTRALLAENLGVELLELPIEPAMRGLRRSCSTASSPAREPDITEENLQARIRGNLADGALEQVRLARADDRQQVRDVGRLLDALRRHRRRLRGHQGRARRRSSTGSSRYATSGRRASWSRASIIERAAERRAAPRPARRGLAAALRRARPDPRRPTSRTTSAREQLLRAGFDAADVDRVIALVDRAEYKRRQAPPGHQDHRRARSAATGACRSRTDTAAERRRWPQL